MSIASRLDAIHQRIATACAQAARDRGSVHLIAVSKTFPSEAIREAYAAGQRDFGESYAQELRDKAHELRDLVDLRWHFIGPIQSNKVRYVAPISFLVHAVSEVRHAEALAAKANTRGLLLVNIGEEDSKHGVSPIHAIERARELSSVPGFELRGLTCIPPADLDPKPFFERLASIAQEGTAHGLPLSELSMGMSQDFEAAISFGATWIRVGSAIFGAREP